MSPKRITSLRPLAYLFWALLLVLGGVLAWLVLGADENSGVGQDGASGEGCTPASPCLALVVDDLGRDLRVLERLLRLQAPITYGVLPHAKHTDRAVRIIRQRGRELIAHLPMRPLDTNTLTDEALVLGMDGPLETVLHECINRVPGAVGVSNHMGSQLTQQVGAMARVMRVLKKRTLYVLDSRTTLRTVVCAEARRLQIPCLDRDLFLDHEPGPENVKLQLHKAVKRARQRGWAVAIAHPKTDSVAVLEQFLRNPGVRVVPLSTLISKAGMGGSGKPGAGDMVRRSSGAGGKQGPEK